MADYDKKKLVSVLAYIKDEYGIACFRDGKVAAYLSDLAPSLKRERSLLQKLSAYNHLQEIAKNNNSDENTQHAVLNKAVKYLTEEEFIQPEIAIKYINIVAKVINYKFLLSCDFDSSSSLSPNVSDLTVASKKVETNNSNKVIIEKIDLLFDQKKYDESFKLCKKLADFGDSGAQSRLGFYYLFGFGCKADSSQAFKYSKMSADQNDPWGQYGLGNMYYGGSGCQQDYYKAFSYYELAAKNDNSDAMVMVGNCYKNGSGVQQNHYEAYKHYKIAADNGNAWGQYHLANALADGRGCVKDTDLAVHYMQLSANQGLQQAIDNLNEFNRGMNEANNKSSSGCFVTTAVCDSFGKADDCYELTAFRAFRDNWLVKEEDGKDLIHEYYAIAPKIVDEINKLKNKSEIYLNIWNKYLKECLSSIEDKNYEKCKSIYTEMVLDLVEQYL